MQHTSIGVVVPVLIRTDKQLAMTKRCLQKARDCTRLPFQLIIVESGSQYLIDYADIYVHEKVPTTPEIGHNIGFRIAVRNDFTVLLTNDVYVTDGWLEVLLDTFNQKEDCGLSTLGSSHKGHIEENKIIEERWFDVAMIKSEVFNKIGFYDERYIGSWPDTDLLVRAYKEGWKMYRNLNCVVDVEGVQTTVGQNPNHSENYIRGQQLFREKHEGCGLAIYEACK